MTKKKMLEPTFKDRHVQKSNRQRAALYYQSKLQKKEKIIAVKAPYPAKREVPAIRLHDPGAEKINAILSLKPTSEGGRGESRPEARERLEKIYVQGNALLPKWRRKKDLSRYHAGERQEDTH